MSSPSRPAPRHEVRSARTCMCQDGGRCDSFGPGHALHLIQARLVSATPSEWADAIVTSVDHAEGSVDVSLVASGVVRRLWNGAGAPSAVHIGEPVAVHERYHVLAVGTARFNYLAVD